MNRQLKRNFNTYFIESRFISVVASIIVILIRFLMFSKRGLSTTPIGHSNFAWQNIEPHLQQYPFLSLVLSTISVFFIAFLISELNNRFGIIRTRSSMPFYIPLLIFSVHPVFLRFTPDLPALILVLWSMFPLLSTYQSNRINKYTFQFSALIAMSSMFQVYAILLIPIWMIGLKVLSRINLRSIFASIFGISVVYWIVFAFYVFADNLKGFTLPFIELVKIYDFSYVPFFEVPQWGFIGVILFLIIYFISVDNRQIIRDRSLTKKILYLSMSIILLSLLLHVVFLFQTIFWIYILLAFLSIIISHFYSNVTDSFVVYSFVVFVCLLVFYMLINTFTDLSPF